MTYKFLEHTADIKIEASSTSLEKAFVSSALALKEVISAKIKVKKKIKKKINIEAKDYERLLYDFLESLLYFLDAEDFLFSKIASLEIKADKSKKKLSLTAEILGDKASNYSFSNNVKAITYNQMSIHQVKSKNKSKTKSKTKSNNKSKNQTVIQFVLDV